MVPPRNFSEYILNKTLSMLGAQWADMAIYGNSLYISRTKIQRYRNDFSLESYLEDEIDEIKRIKMSSFLRVVFTSNFSKVG